jgi:DNA polymerase III sliding clamp (beta) subunit (PCNA family)
MKITIGENKTTNSDSLVFYSKDGNLNIFLDNGFSSINLLLGIEVEDFNSFAVDAGLFYNAFSNFPSDEVQFAYIEEDHSIIFGNKKTRVSLKSSVVSNLDFLLSKSFDLGDDIQFTPLNQNEFVDAFKLTSFSCANDVDEHPYTSIMFFIEDDKFNCYSSDKHRISLYGNTYTDQKSYLIAKNSADLLLNTINKNESYDYFISKNRFYLRWSNHTFSTLLENNIYQNVFSYFNNFLEQSKFELKTTFVKDDFIQSVKYIGNISSSHSITMSFTDGQLILSGSSSDKGAIVDKIEISENSSTFDVSYLSSHLIKAIETFPGSDIVFSIYNYNDFYIMVFEAEFYKHIIFPMP